MKKSSVIWLVVIIILIVVGVIIWANYSAAPTSTSASPTATAVTTTAAPLILDTGSSTALGTYLVASNGMTLYHYTVDTPGVSNCTGQCAVMWPPYTVSSGTALTGAPTIGGTIATIMRADGTMQVTYNGQPLYFWSRDVNPGDTTGQNVNNFFVVAP